MNFNNRKVVELGLEDGGNLKEVELWLKVIYFYTIILFTMSFMNLAVLLAGRADLT